MTVTRGEQAAEALVRFGAQIMRRSFPDQAPSCIAWSRIGRDVLARLGVRSECVPVTLRVANNQAREHLAAGRPDLVCSGDGSWVVAVGGGGRRRAGRWDGHMVVLVEGIALVDLTLHQAARPERGIRVGPSWFALEEPFVHGSQVVYELCDGVALRYERKNDLPPWEQSPAWRNDYGVLVARLTDRLRVVLDS